jgi:pantothenate kinase
MRSIPRISRNLCYSWCRMYPERVLSLGRQHFPDTSCIFRNNIGQIAYLVAQQHGLKRIYFGGCYIRGRKLAHVYLATCYAVD